MKSGILHSCRGEHRCILLTDNYVFAETLQIEIPRVLAVRFNAAGGWIVGTEDELEKGRLPGPGVAPTSAISGPGSTVNVMFLSDFWVLC